MYNRHIRHLVTELGNRLSDKEFLKKIGLSRRSMQQLFDKDRWEVIFEKAFPVTRRFSWVRDSGILPREGKTQQ